MTGPEGPPPEVRRTVAGPGGGRRYGGRSSEQRRAERRARLMHAAFEVIGAEGYAAAPIERLCSVAGVATRSFYEEFPRRESLLLAVYGEVMRGAIGAVEAALATAPAEPAPRIRAGLEAYVRHITEDPRRARIAHHEMRAVGVLETERHAAAVAFARVIEREVGALPQHAAADRRRLLGLALTGAVSELLVDWTLTDPHPPIEPMAEVLTQLFVRALA